MTSSTVPNRPRFCTWVQLRRRHMPKAPRVLFCQEPAASPGGHQICARARAILRSRVRSPAGGPFFPLFRSPTCGTLESGAPAATSPRTLHRGSRGHPSAPVAGMGRGGLSPNPDLDLAPSPSFRNYFQTSPCLLFLGPWIYFKWQNLIKTLQINNFC